MKLTFYSIHRAPRMLPIWHRILEDLGFPSPKAVAKVLGVGVRTVYRWNRTGAAPRSACLALFWLTRWGHSQVHSQAVNDAALAVQYVQALKTELDRAKLELAHVLAVANTGAEPAPQIGGSHVR